MNALRDIIFIVSVFIIVSCGSNQDNGNKEALVVSDSSKVTEGDSTEILSLPAVFQIPNALKKIKSVRFNEKILAALPSDKGSESSTAKAFLVGIYGVDLGYSLLNGQNQLAMKYLDGCTRIGQDLHLSSIIDTDLHNKVIENKSNIDTIVSLVLTSFNQMNQKLLSEGRKEVAYEMFTGSFIEGAYLISQRNDIKSVKEIRCLFGEQKMFLANIIKLVSDVNLGDGSEEVIQNLKKLSSSFESVKVIEKQVNRNAKAIVDIEITDQQIDEITRQIILIRNLMIN